MFLWVENLGGSCCVVFGLFVFYQLIYKDGADQYGLRKQE